MPATASSSRSLSVDEDLKDLAAAARARLELARALLAGGDPAGRALLEDAGTLYEDLGAEDVVLAIDRELRALTYEIEESPRSFTRRLS